MFTNIIALLHFTYVVCTLYLHYIIYLPVLLVIILISPLIPPPPFPSPCQTVYALCPSGLSNIVHIKKVFMSNYMFNCRTKSCNLCLSYSKFISELDTCTTASTTLGRKVELCTRDSLPSH